MGTDDIKINPFEILYDTCNSSTDAGDFPLMVDIELTNTCNFECSMCPTGNGSVKREQGFMSDKTWGTILIELERHKTPIRFARWGEPTLHPALYEYIIEANHHGLLTHLTTNGSKLDVDLAAKHLDSIKFSVHSQNGVFTKATELFNKEHRPYIAVYGYGDTKIPSGCCDESKDMKVKNLSEPVKEYYPCHEVLSRLSVDWDGVVTACCGDYDRKMIVGDVHKNTLAEIWVCNKLDYYRKMLSEMRHSELLLCRSCVGVRNGKL